MTAQAEFATLASIRSKYPDEWVLVGNPVLKDENLQTALVENLVGGIVLEHDKNRRSLAARAYKARIGYSSVVLVYTGVIPRNRKFLL